MDSHHNPRTNFAKRLQEHLHKHPARVPSIQGKGTDSLAAWFLGPKAENEELFRSLVVRALSAHMDDRRDFAPDDPVFITEEMKHSHVYQDSVDGLSRHLDDLLDALKGSVPFFSYRYQAHMLWDVTMPGMLGYFAAMMYNQNNVAAEASPVTTLLEMEVGDDLCRMLGYPVPENQKMEGEDGGMGGMASSGPLKPWGHITCDGSVANMEAMWAARNLKYYPVAIAAALRDVTELAYARDVSVRLPNGEWRLLLDLSTWELLNLSVDQILSISNSINSTEGIEPGTLEGALTAYSLQDVGFMKFQQMFLKGAEAELAMFAPATAHYSWPKAATLMGMGRNSLELVPVDLDARMSVDHLKRSLKACLKAKRPVGMVISVMGSTEESAVDPLADILELRESFRKKGLEFYVHVDAAWGGYFASLLRKPGEGQSVRDVAELAPDVASHLDAKHTRVFVPEMTMSRYVNRQYEALGQADSITVDPHKAGYIPYPAGGLCYRNGATRDIVSFTAPVVFHGGVDPTVGVYGIEGSKPGAAAAATFLSHRVIRPDQSGYGKILGQCMFNSKRLYAAVVTMAREEDNFTVVPFQRLPVERAGGGPEEIAKQLWFIGERIVPPSNEELLKDKEAMELMRELGSDQIIISYTFNLKTEEGVNTDPDRLIDLNKKLFRKLSLNPGQDDVMHTPMIVTSSDFDPAVYGTGLVGDYMRRLGLEGPAEKPIPFLISTTMDPWVTETAEGNFIPVLIDALRDIVTETVKEVLDQGDDHGG